VPRVFRKRVGVDDEVFVVPMNEAGAGAASPTVSVGVG
jgi:hypothetical protein